jgi:hypothetical protein
MSGWRVHTDAPVHVWPDGDLVDHEVEGDDCVCGVTSEPVARDDGSFGWVNTHHALDGRE